MEHNIFINDLVIYYNYYNNANIIENYAQKQINDFLKRYNINNIEKQEINNDLLRTILNNQTMHNNNNSNNTVLLFTNTNNIIKTY